MSFRPAGYSSDEDDDFGLFSFGEDSKSEKEIQKDIAAEIYRKRVESENTPQRRFYNAILKEDVNQITEELQNGFDVNSEISSDWTALFLSVMQGNPLIVEELLKNGADINLTRDGSTPLMAACSCHKSSTKAENTVNIVRLLISYGIDIKAKDRKRRNAFMFSCSQGFIDVVKLLLPLNNLEETDNQGWTALFYAVEENNHEIVKFLIENGANIDHVDIRNNSIKYYATVSDYDLILNLLPKNDFEISPNDFADRLNNYESIFDSLEDGERPDCIYDIYSLLYGMRCQNFIPIFNNANIGLVKFLTIDDESLKELGIPLSFQRNRILQGLFRFHEHSWLRKSIPFVPLEETFTTQDIFVTLVNTIKHLIVLQATIQYIKQNLNLNELNMEKDIVSVKTLMVLRKINRMKKTVNLLHAEILNLDTKNHGQVDLITTKRKFRRNALNKKLALGFTGVTLVFLFRYLKSNLFSKLLGSL